MLFLALMLAAGQADSPSEPPSELPPGLLLSYLVPDDYPAAALDKREQGQVRFIVGVSPEGRVISCTIAQSSGSSTLDAKTCEVARRMRLKPNRDSLGPAVADRYRGVLTWLLPRP